MAEEKKIRPPRGALIVIAIGLLATVAAALLSTDEAIGTATLEWVEEAPMRSSKPVTIPGGGQMQLAEAEIRSTEPNISDYTLFRVSAVLTIDAGSAVGHGRLSCAVHVPSPTIVAQTYKSRAAYPRSSEDLFEQDTPETSLVKFSSHSTELASVDVSDVFGKRYTTEKGIVVEWAPYRIGQQVWKLGLPSGRPKEDLKLPFVSIWRTTATPAARMACTVETAAGSATVRTAGSLPG
ncbi:MAG TPA: hypothetical protein VGN84_07030 [Solirubrobacterales bacterium]|jgi:hypothetical protein|nr:hypothetical protein [Solirubrobacterales bacterium]